MKKILSAIILLASSSNMVDAKQIDIQSETLDNGLKVVIAKMKSNGSVRFGIMYNVGCADDQSCKVGLSHFLEHMMFKGTKTIPGTQLKYLFDKYDAYTNAYTSNDCTMYYHTVNNEFLEIDMKLEADRMVNLTLNDNDVDQEQKVVAEERNLRYDANPEIRHIYDVVPRLLYLHSNYAYNGIGYPHHIKAYTKRSLQRHYNKFYTPNNATVIVVGDIDKDSVLKLVKNTLGKIKKTHDVHRQRVIDPEDIDISYTADRVSDKVTGKTISIAFKVPRENMDTLKKLYISKIAIDCICGTPVSLMAKKFVEEENLLYNIDGNVEMKAFDKAFVFIEANVTESTSVKDIDGKICSDLAEIADKQKISSLISKEAFDAVKNKFLSNILMMSDNPGRMFDHISWSVVEGYKLSEISDTYNIVSKITWEDVKNWIVENMKSNNKVMTLYSHPKGSL